MRVTNLRSGRKGQFGVVLDQSIHFLGHIVGFHSGDDWTAVDARVDDWLGGNKGRGVEGSDLK